MYNPYIYIYILYYTLYIRMVLGDYGIRIHLSTCPLRRPSCNTRTFVPWRCWIPAMPCNVAYQVASGGSTKGYQWLSLTMDS